MAELRHKEKTISTKIVYYGPGMSGKTTNIQVLHQHAGGTRRGELVSVNTAQDRTIMFDLLPIKVAAFRGLDLKVQLVAVPGQPMYAAIRKLALKDVDALVFVASSAPDQQDENVTSLKELMANLARPGSDVSSFPIVLQYNKRDLPNAVSTAAMDQALNSRKAPTRPAVAVRGEGVLETFTQILTLTVAELARRYKLTDTGRGQTVDEWAQAAVQEIFGTKSFASSGTNPAAEGAGRRTVRMTLPTDVAGAERLDARTNEALVESYAEVAASLTEGAQTIRDERDLAQRRLSDVLEVLDVGKALKPGAPRDSVHAAILGCLAREVDAPHASLLVPAPNQGLKAAAFHKLERDPILAQADGVPRLRNLLQASYPRWYETEDPAIQKILTASRPPHGSVVAVPLAVGQEAPTGLALLYRAPSAPPPRRESLKHLGDLAHILASFLESSHSSSGDRDTELLGTAVRLGVPRLLNELRDVRQKLADLRRRPDSPVWLSGALAEIAPAIGEAAGLGRALTALETGALEAEPVELAAFLGKLGGSDVTVDIGHGVKTAKVDPALFGLAVGALIDRARRAGGAVEVRGTAQNGRILVRIGGKGSGGSTKGADPGLALATKIVEMHGGRVSAEADPATGSWTVLDLP